MNTLEKIIAHKRIEVKEREDLYPIELLKKTNTGITNHKNDNPADGFILSLFPE